MRGTYSAKGFKNLHIVGINDEDGVPARVLELRNHFLKSKAKFFGRLVSEIRTLAIWDSTETYCEDLGSLHHVGENMFYIEWLQLFEARGDFESVLVPASVSVIDQFIICSIRREGNRLNEIPFVESYT